MNKEVTEFNKLLSTLENNLMNMKVDRDIDDEFDKKEGRFVKMTFANPKDERMLDRYRVLISQFNNDVAKLGSKIEIVTFNQNGKEAILKFGMNCNGVEE